MLFNPGEWMFTFELKAFVASRKEHLQLEVLKVFSLYVSHGTHLEPEWIPHKENEWADCQSHSRFR